MGWVVWVQGAKYIVDGVYQNVLYTLKLCRGPLGGTKEVINKHVDVRQDVQVSAL